MDRILQKLDRVVIFFIIYTVIFLLLFKTLAYTLPFVLAFIFALILQRPTKYITRNLKIKNSIASILTTLIFFTFILTILALIITSVTTEVIQLGKNTQAYITNNTALINSLFETLKQYYQNLDQSVVLAIQNNLSSSISRITNITAAAIGGAATGLLGFLASVPYIIMVVLFTFLATYFFTKDMTSAKNKFMNIVPSQSSGKIKYIFVESKKMLTGYAYSYSIIIFITFIETLIGFSILHVKYALTLSIVSAIFDILPLLGIGSVYMPVALIYLISKNYYTFGGILVLYALVSFFRQIIEPKLVSSSLGIHPVPILAAIFIGLRVNGISGMFFCIFLVVFYNIFKKVNVL